MTDQPQSRSGTRKPRLKAPPGACDTHLHLYGPFDKYPLSSNDYTPALPSTLDDYLEVYRGLGIDRAVIMTGGGNGTNNSVTYDAIQRMDGAFKGVALLDPNITDKELLYLKDGGFTGFRIRANGHVALGFEDAKRIAPRVKDFGWHVEFHVNDTGDALDALPKLRGLGLPYVLDHVARLRPEKGTDDPGFREVVATLKGEENCWVNLYSFYQLTNEGPPHYSDMIQIFQALVEARPDRLIWGTNWPHLQIKVPMPDNADLLDFLLDAVPGESARNAILADNPARLYGWPED